MIDLTQWLNPDAYYTGPVDHEVTDLEALAQFWSAAETETVATMRTRWPEFRGRVPNQLAADLISDIEARRSQCS